MERLAWIIRLILLLSHEPLKVGNLSRQWKEGNVTLEGWSERCYTAGFEDGEECGQRLAAGKSKGTDSSLEPPEETQPCLHLDFKIAELQNYKIIHLC